MSPLNLLVDYGEVISLRQPAEFVTRLAELAQLEETRFIDRYWQARIDYDRGRPAAEYWADVLDRERVPAELLASLIEVDIRSWTCLNPATLALLTRLHQKGARLSLLSNAPHELADAITVHPTFQMFEHLLFSARLGVVKPDQQIFRLAMATIGTTPGDVVFVDDRAENIVAAKEFGLGAVLFTSVDQLRVEVTSCEFLAL